MAQSTDPYSKFRSTSRFGSLDGLRCISILAVIWHHGPGFDMEGLPGRGFLGVDLFFAISGFLITTLLLREREKYGTISLKNFYLRRVLRIFPLYFTVLGMYVALIGLTSSNTASGKQFFDNLPYFLTYTSNWFVGAAPVTFGFAWSLAAEEQFYSVWPWIERYLPGNRPLWIIVPLILIVLWLMALPMTTGPEGYPDWMTRQVTAKMPLAICLGILMAHVLHSRRGFATLFPVFGKKWVSVAMLVLVPALMASRGPRWLVNITMAALVLSCVIREDHYLSRFLMLRPMVHIGVVSYGLYMLHGFAYNTIHRIPVIGKWNLYAIFPLAVALAVLYATISFKYYEGWFLRLKDRFSRVRAS